MKMSFTPAASAFFLAGSNSSPCRTVCPHHCSRLMQGSSGCLATAELLGSIGSAKGLAGPMSLLQQSFAPGGLCMLSPPVQRHHAVHLRNAHT